MTESGKKKWLQYLYLIPALLLILGTIAFTLYARINACSSHDEHCYIPKTWMWAMLWVGGIIYSCIIVYALFRKIPKIKNQRRFLAIGHSSLLLVATIAFLIYHHNNPDWVEAPAGWYPHPYMLTAWHRQLSNEVAIPFMFVNSLLLFFAKGIRWYYKIAILITIAMLILLT